MAVFGVDIFDADGANETYRGIMGLYNSGAEIELIEKEYPLKARDDNDDFDNELYITVCAFAYWELGLLDESRLAFVKSVLEKGETVRKWMEEDKRLGEQRELVLKKYWDKISRPPKRIKKRKRFEKIFDVDDVIAIGLPDGSHRAFVCVDVDKYFKGGYYSLAPTTYRSVDPPAIEKILESEMLVCPVIGSYDIETILSQNPGIDKVWNFLETDRRVMYRLVGVRMSKGEIKRSQMKFSVIGRISVCNWIRQFSVTTILNKWNCTEERYFAEGFHNWRSVAVPVRLIVTPCERA